MYANDSQLYIDFSSCDEETAMANLQLCTQGIQTWLRDNFLLLNEQKTEVVKFGRKFTGNHLQIGEASICSSSRNKLRMYPRLLVIYVTACITCLQVDQLLLTLY